MGGRADLHIHTYYSDGVLAPREVVSRARTRGLSAIAITDHDHTAGIAEALAAGAAAGVEVIPGIELSATLGGIEVHILGYFIDPPHSALQDFLAMIREERRKRAHRIVEKLKGLNVPLEMDAVLEQAGAGSVGRPHIAGALVELGLTGSYQEAFVRYLGTGRPAYEDKFPVAAAEAIRVIRAAGGLSFVAHPGTSMSESVLLALVREGIDGIEIVHPSHTAELTRHYQGIADEYYLLTCGGSDYHGGRRNDEEALGKHAVPLSSVEAMKRRLR
jgi:predicted metal-dependent phosphoesterase TrpH